MDIRDWPIDRIMQLPDWCFGPRRLVGCGDIQTVGGAHFILSHQALPEAFVVWEVHVSVAMVSLTGAACFLKMADQLPDGIVEFGTLEDLLQGFGRRVETGYEVRVVSGGPLHLTQLRQPVQAAGRRLFVSWDFLDAALSFIDVLVVVSSIPKEVPDWICSARV